MCKRDPVSEAWSAPPFTFGKASEVKQLVRDATAGQQGASSAAGSRFSMLTGFQDHLAQPTAGGALEAESWVRLI